MAIKLFTTLCCLFSLAHAGIQQKDFTGLGRIYVLQSEDWRTATPEQKLGCLSTQGRFIKDSSPEDCGVFARLEDYPYTLSTKAGNCTFDDETQERNTDSVYGQQDNAWSCKQGYKSEIYDELYTITGFPYVFLCFGDIACYYDAKRAPTAGEKLPLWQYRWGSQQRGITPGHIQLQLLWDKVGELPKRGGEDKAIPGPRVEIGDAVQVPLLGRRARR
ncbi:hypothetical protein IQ07DRAFT_594992 [Pyrenochaeta sp. DS3sAY3a]|nr:hypothetical protein IQ07DRAFT_594992 [Pyrenochaeta sp. DS3sAY3a]